MASRVDDDPDRFRLRDLIMNSPQMERVRRVAERAVRSPLPILIEGERGVGKELLARAIHAAGPRRGRPFIALACAGIDAATIETAIFGASGVTADRLGGKLQEANGGTLYLEEIGSLPRAIQARLTTFLVEGETVRPGATASRRLDVRLIAASGGRLIELVSLDGFREDLFYRLNVFPIWLPPLRERRTDIAELARTFFKRLAAEERRSDIAGIAAEAMDLLVAHDWPGNIRELENAVFRAIALCAGGKLSPQDFPQLLAAVGPGIIHHGLPVAGGSQPGPVPANVADQRQVLPEDSRNSAPLPDRKGAARYGLARLLDEHGELRPFEVLEEEVIRFAIDHYRGHMSEVARRLGIGRSTLYRKIKDYGIASDEVMAP